MSTHANAAPTNTAEEPRAGRLSWSEVMSECEPASARAIAAGTLPPTPWIEARWRLEEAQFYWLATVQPDSRPHTMPVLAIWQDGSLFVSMSPASRKARNLAAMPTCTVTVDGDDLHVVVEGDACRVTDHLVLRRLAEAYASKYGWEVVVRDGALHGDGAPSAGPPPYVVYAITPTTVFGFGTDDTYGSTRWRFASHEATDRP